MHPSVWRSARRCSPGWVCSDTRSFEYARDDGRGKRRADRSVHRVRYAWRRAS
jgi:hypothetical protein